MVTIIRRVSTHSHEDHLCLYTTQIAELCGQYGAHLDPVGPRWAPRWPRDPCYQGTDSISKPHLPVKALNFCSPLRPNYTFSNCTVWSVSDEDPDKAPREVGHTDILRLWDPARFNSVVFARWWTIGNGCGGTITWTLSSGKHWTQHTTRQNISSYQITEACYHIHVLS